jgi:uncharacterized protein YggE
MEWTHAGWQWYIGETFNGGNMQRFILLLIAGMLSATCAVAQQQPAAAELPKISVSGEAVVNVVPDKIIITLGIETWDTDIRNAKEKNNDILHEAIAAIRRTGVADKDIQTDHLSIEPRYKDSYRKEEFIGYFVRNSFAVTITKAENVEKLVTTVLEAGVNYIHGIDFQTTEFAKHREQARALALAAAKEKARKMAAVLDMRIGAPLQINENYSGSPWGYWSGWGGGRSAGMSQNVMQNIPSDASGISGSVALGKIAIRASVGVTFALTE